MRFFIAWNAGTARQTTPEEEPGHCYAIMRMHAQLPLASMPSHSGLGVAGIDLR
jgi:hypothetical protein